MANRALAHSVDQPVIDAAQLARASADPDRVEPLVRKWRRNPDEYIKNNYHNIVDFDFPVYAAANIRITDKYGRSVNLVFNRVQRRLWQWFLEDLAAGRPVRWFIIKARQLGCSTWILSLLYWLSSLRANRNVLIVAHDEAATTNFNSRFRAIHAESHCLLKSQTILDRRDIVHFGNKTTARQRGAGAGLDSRAIFATAARGELGRSYNFHAALLSEFCIWPELGINIDDQLVALNQTIADLPGTMIILESTAKGVNESTRMWEDKDNGYRKIFLSWVCDDTYRRNVNRPLGDLCGTDEAGGKPTRYGNELEESRFIREALDLWYPEEIEAGGQEWLDAEIEARLNWRRYTIDKKCQGDVTAFRREYPTVAKHAFLSTSKNCFDQLSLEQMREAVLNDIEAKPKRFSYTHDPENTDANIKFQLNPYGPVYVYKTPQIGQSYVIAGDPGMGIPNSGDPSALLVLSVPELEEVASFNEIITPDRFAELAYYLGLIYNTALLGIENNERGGYAANLKLSKEMHYPRLYYRFDYFDKKAAAKPGFATTETNKSVRVSELQQLIRDHEILFRTPQLNDQLQHYMLLSDGTMGGAQGWNDDLVSAALIAVHLASKVHLYNPPQDQAPKGSFAWYAQRHAERRKPGLFGFKR